MSTDEKRRACPVCGEMILVEAKLCRFCGEKFVAPPADDQQSDATGGVIPYKNPPALIAYYCGLFSLAACIPIPFLFLPLPIAALWLGIKGLKKANAEPHARGRVHAWIGHCWRNSLRTAGHRHDDRGYNWHYRLLQSAGKVTTS